MQHDVLTLSDVYSDRGYAYVNVDPRTQVDPATHTVNVAFNVNPGREVLVDRINITGNSKTSDKVIRRELTIQEQEPYSTSKIQNSKRRLDSLGYFSNTRITTSPGPQPDEIDLDVAVQEANTASLQIGGGYDSQSSVFGNFSLGNTNLFGGGEVGLGQCSDRFSLPKLQFELHRAVVPRHSAGRQHADLLQQAVSLLI